MKLIQVIGLVVAASMAQVFGVGPPAMADSDASFLSLPPPQVNELVITGQESGIEHKKTLTTANATIDGLREHWRDGSCALSDFEFADTKIAPVSQEDVTDIAKEAINIDIGIESQGIADIGQWTSWFRPMLC